MAYETRNYLPHAKSQVFHSDPRACRWYCAGYGSGKTTAGVIEAYVNATVNHPGYTGIVVAPTYNLLMQAWFAEWQLWIPRDVWVYRQDSIRGVDLTVTNGEGVESKILLRSTSKPAGLEGVNAAWMVFDEASREPRIDSYNVLTARLRRGYPGRQRTVLLTGPPNTRKHWTASEFGIGPDPAKGLVGSADHWGNETHAVVRARTRDNPYLPDGYELKLRGRPGATKAWCRQYLDAEFGSVEGQIWSMFTRDVHVIPHERAVTQAWMRKAVGVDWGYAHPGVMLVGGLDNAGNIYVWHEEIHANRVVDASPEGWLTIAQRLQGRFRASRYYCDPSSPGNIAALNAHLRAKCAVTRPVIYRANNDVGEGLRRVAALMEGALTKGQKPGIYISDKCLRTIECIEAYQHARARDGSFEERPVKVDDDPADALRYLVMGLTSVGNSV